MKYKVGRPGRIIVVKFDDHDDVLEGIVDIARKEDIRAGVFTLLGGMREGRIVVGPETEELPPTPVWREIEESHEVVGQGTIFWEGEEPKIHFHGAFGKKDKTRVGCLRERAKTFLVLEAVITEIDGVRGTREIDPSIGMAILKLH